MRLKIELAAPRDGGWRGGRGGGMEGVAVGEVEGRVGGGWILHYLCGSGGLAARHLFVTVCCQELTEESRKETLRVTPNPTK